MESGVLAKVRNGEQFLTFVRHHTGRLARLQDLTCDMIQAWMDDMAAADLAIEWEFVIV